MTAYETQIRYAFSSFANKDTSLARSFKKLDFTPYENIICSKTLLEQNFDSMFQNCKKLKSIPVVKFPSGMNIINRNYDFHNFCAYSGVEAIPSGSYYGKASKNMAHSAFRECKSLSSIPADFTFDINLNTTNVCSMAWIFNRRFFNRGTSRYDLLL